MSNILLASALKYAKVLRWPVHPLKPGTKEPATEHGYQDATLDIEQIKRWWNRWPNANIGVPTGISFWVLDEDPRNGGNESLERLEARHGRLPNTRQQQTGGGGRHFAFAMPDQMEIRCGTLADGLDYKGSGGYIVVAPSVHPNGRVYTWDGADELVNQPILPAPGWLLAMLQNGQRNRGGVPLETPQKIPKGKQHATLVSIAGSMRARGLEFPEIFQAVRVVNETRCSEPGPIENIRKIAESVCRYPPGARNGDEQEKAGHARETDAPAVPQWPADLREEAFHGVAGELVRAIEPNTEADPAALLIQFLVGFGSLTNRGPYVLAEADHHHTNEDAVVVGATARARKGTSWGRIRAILRAVDDYWVEERLVSGLGSGEALIEAVDDDDKRALIIEPEFARLLAVVNREGSTLSAIVRDAWDTGAVAVRTRKNSVRVSGAHISLIGHITREELLRRLTETEMANGFVNRILFMCARRTRVLPFGGGSVEAGEIIRKLKRAVEFARKTGNTRVEFDDEARALWVQVYNGLSEGKPGLLGAVISRADPHVLRLSLIYAVLDCSRTIQGPHLRAALAVWDRCAQSARYIFGDSLGDPLADELVRALRVAGDAGLTRLDITNHFSRNKAAAELDRALATLIERGLIRFAMENTGGRAGTRYWLL